MRHDGETPACYADFVLTVTAEEIIIFFYFFEDQRHFWLDHTISRLCATKFNQLVTCAGRQKSLATTDIESCLLNFFSIESGLYKI